MIIYISLEYVSYCNQWQKVSLSLLTLESFVCVKKNRIQKSDESFHVVPQSRKKPRMEQGVIFIDDDELASQNNLLTSQKWTADSFSQATEVPSAGSSCVSTHFHTQPYSYIPVWEFVHGNFWVKSEVFFLWVCAFAVIFCEMILLII